VGEVRERYDAAFPDAQHFFKHLARVLQGLQGFFEHDDIEGLVRAPAQAGAQVGLDHGHAAVDAGKHLIGIDLDALAAHVALADQAFEQEAVAAAEVEDEAPMGISREMISSCQRAEAGSPAGRWRAPSSARRWRRRAVRKGPRAGGRGRGR
jgi:hypothetical protein